MGEVVPNQFPSVRPPKVAFVGESPGREEVAVGRPFVGPAGRELDLWLRNLFVRSQCFIGNLSQERPPNDRLEEWFLDPKCQVPNERLAHWISVLKAQLEELRPNLIVALGNLPTFVLAGRTNILKQWGSVLPCTLIPGLKVMPLPHPSFVIRGRHDLRPIIRVWMRRAKAQSEFPEYRPPLRELVVDPSLEQVMYHLERLKEAPELAADIETVPGCRLRCRRRVQLGNRTLDLVYTPELISCLSLSDRPDWAISIPFSRAGGQHRWSLEMEKQIWRKVSELLGQPGPLKIFHNLMFDFLQLAGHGIFVAPPYYDTMVAHNRANLDLTKKKLKDLQLNRLAFCTALYTEEPFYKDDHKDVNRGSDWQGADREFWIYNAKDSAVLHEIKMATKADLQDAGTWHLFEKDMKVFEVLACMGLQGVRRDVGKVEELRQQVDQLILQLQQQLDEEAGQSLNVKSSLQMRRFLYGDLGLPVQVNRKTGRPTTDEGAIAKLYQKTKLPVLRTITRLTRFRTFRQNYLAPNIGEDGRTRTTYNQAKTSTARISSSDAVLGEGKNLQTIPTYPRPGEDDYNRLIVEFRNTFQADPGMVMWKRDYRQAEAMVVAWLSEDLQLINDFLSGIDIHCRTLEILFDVPYEEAVQRCAEGDPLWKIRRNLGKRVRHGANYRMGEKELQKQLLKQGIDLEVRECRRLLQAMVSSTPAISRWHAEVIDTLHSTRTICNRFGRKRVFLGPITDETIQEAIAFDPQSTVADLLNFALSRIYQEAGLMAEMDLLLQLHDAVLGQSPAHLVRHHTRRVGELMAIPLQIKGRTLVIPSDLEVGPDWGALKKPEWLE